MKPHEIIENRHDINRNKDHIERNKEAIAEIKDGCGKCVSQSVFKEMMNGYVATIHRLILAVCIMAAVLFISNILWIIVWSNTETVKKETTIITNDGMSNLIGNDGNIKNGE